MARYDDTARRGLAMLRLLAIALTVTALTPASAHAPQFIQGHPGDRCTEDMVCWDCQTMGNHQCGPRR